MEDQFVIENTALNRRTIFMPDGTEREEPIDPSRRIRQARGREIEIREAKPKRTKPKHRPRHGKKMNGISSISEQYLQDRIQFSRFGAQKRGLSFNITEKDIRELLELQNYKCYYSGIEFEFSVGEGMWGAENAFGFSIDRKDATKGYTRDNIVLCCNVINTSKGQMSSEEYLKRVWKEAREAFNLVGWGEPSEKDVWGFILP